MRTVDVICDSEKPKGDMIQVCPDYPIILHPGEDVHWCFYDVGKGNRPTRVEIEFDDSNDKFFECRPNDTTHKCSSDMKMGRGHRTGTPPEVVKKRKHKYTIRFLKGDDELDRLDPEIVTSWP